MEILDQSLLKDCSGKVDGMIVYKVGNKTYARRMPDEIRDPKSEKQLVQRERFPAVQAFYQSVKNCILKDINDLAARDAGRRSGYHLFMHFNIMAFGKDNFIDYSLLHLAHGSQQLAYNLNLIAANGARAEFAWMDNSSSVTAQGSDRLMVAVVFDDDPYRVVMLDGVNARRKDECALLVLPEGDWKEAHLYCFFGTDDRKRFSPSVYFKVTKP